MAFPSQYTNEQTYKRNKRAKHFFDIFIYININSQLMGKTTRNEIFHYDSKSRIKRSKFSLTYDRVFLLILNLLSHLGGNHFLLAFSFLFLMCFFNLVFLPSACCSFIAFFLA